MPQESSPTFLRPSYSSFYQMVSHSHRLSNGASVHPSEMISARVRPWRTIHRSRTICCTTAAHPQLVKVIEDAFGLQKL